MNAVRRMLKTFWQGDCGASAVEFGFVFPVWLLTMTGMADWGLAIMTRYQLERALNTAVDVAVAHADAAVVTNAVLNAGLDADMKTALETWLAGNPPTIESKCADGSAPKASGFCDDAGAVPPFTVVTVRLQYSYDMWYDWPGLTDGKFVFDISRSVSK